MAQRTTPLLRGVQVAATDASHSPGLPTTGVHKNNNNPCEPHVHLSRGCIDTLRRDTRVLPKHTNDRRHHTGGHRRRGAPRLPREAQVRLARSQGRNVAPHQRCRRRHRRLITFITNDAAGATNVHHQCGSSATQASPLRLFPDHPHKGPPTPRRRLRQLAPHNSEGRAKTLTNSASTRRHASTRFARRWCCHRGERSGSTG